MTDWFSEETEADKLKRQLHQKGPPHSFRVLFEIGLTPHPAADIQYANLQSDLDQRLRELDELKLNFKEAQYKVD